MNTSAFEGCRFGLEKVSMNDYPGHPAAVLFSPGCNLRCPYCHNGSLVNAPFPEDLVSFDEAAAYLRKRRNVLDSVCISGGEPTFQAKALIPLCRMLKDAGIHICIDSNGSIWNKEVEELFSLADLVLLDIKEFNDKRHQTLTARSNEQTLKTAAWLEKAGKPFWLRYVLVKGYSFFEEDIRALGEHFKDYRMIERVEILPYHTLGMHKYEAMGLEYKLKDVAANTPEELERARLLFEEYFKTVYVN